MKLTTTVLVALLISANLYAGDEPLSPQKHFGSKTALLVFFDVAGLNNYNSNPSLVKQNLAKYKQIITKQHLQKAKVESIAYFTFDEQVKRIGKIETNKSGRLFRESKLIMRDVFSELQEDTSVKSKDVISAFSYINNVVEQSYNEYQEVTVLFFSNMRDSMTTKMQRQQMQPIELNAKVKLYIFAASGLNALGATTQQKMRAESSIVSFYKQLLSSSNVVIKTIY